MKWFLDIAYIGLAASYKWILVAVAVIGILVGVLFAAGVLGGGDDDTGTTVFTAPDPLPTVTPAPMATISPSPTPVPTRVPTATPAPVVLPTSTPPPTPTKVVVVLREIQVPINLVGAENVGSLEFVLVYEPEVLEVTDVQPGSLAGQALLEFNTATPGLLWTGLVDADGVNGDGAVAIVTFTVKRGVGDNSQLSLQNVVAYDAASLLDIIVEPSPGNFSARENIISIPYLTFTP